MKLSLALAAGASLISAAHAHTFIWGVYLNGVDQGTFRGIRTPGYNGPPPRGYSNSPVKDLDSMDIRCNVFGDHQVAHTIVVEPGDNLTLDWHHDKRSDLDDVIADSHHGPALAYLSPDPPTSNSFVKIWEKGLYELPAAPLAPGKWATTSDIAANHGHMNVRIPAGLRPGFYLLRAELIGLHEADVSYKASPARGAQFYPNCVQLEVAGNGTVALPADGVDFPGAYKYSDPGVVHDVYCSTKTTTTKPCTTAYVVPGPTVWSGAWAETTAVELGPIVGQTTGPARWSSWVVKAVATSAEFDGAGANNMKVLGSAPYAQTWSTAYQEPTPGANWP